MNNEQLQFSINRLDLIILNADNKASFLLSFVSAVLAGLWLIKKDLLNAALSHTLIYFCFALFFISILSCFYAIWPRSKGKFSGLKGKGSILNFESLKNETVSALPQNETEIMNQIKALSTIISHKLMAVRIAFISAFFGTLIIFIIMFLDFSCQK